MRLTTDFAQKLPHRHRAVVVGAFDGLHIGHQYLIRRTCAEAAAEGLESTVFTFEPLPHEFLSPGKSRRTRLTVAEERAELMRELCVDRLVVARFDADFSRISAKRFVSDILIGKLNATTLVAAENHAFGHGAEADIHAIRALARRYDLRMIMLPLLQLDGMRVSSTQVRTFLRDGHVEEAAGLLGRHYAMRGQVVSGKGTGRSLGFPTANLQVPPNKLVPAPGVYAALVDGPSLREQLMPRSGPYAAAVNIGPQPTFDAPDSTIEAHVIGTDNLELLGSQIELRFVRRLRQVQRFPNIASLRAQIARDVASVRTLTDDNST
jgi:riboflavin kinase / FMN adenylyltransferase